MQKNDRLGPFLGGFAACLVLCFILGGSFVEWKQDGSHSSFSFHLSVGQGTHWEFSKVFGVVLGVLMDAAAAWFYVNKRPLQNAAPPRRDELPNSPAANSEPAAPPNVAEFLQRLTTSKKDYIFGGVCGGLGEHTPIPSWIWRLGFCCCLFFYGAGLLAYILLWMFVPQPKG